MQEEQSRLHICTSRLLYKEYSDHKIYIILYFAYDGAVRLACAMIHNNHAYRIRSTEFSYTKARQFQLDEFAVCSRKFDHAYHVDVYICTEVFKNIL